MAFIEHKGNLLYVERGILTHGCNTAGVMGAGIAKAIKDEYPSVFRAYRDHYVTQGLKLGEVIFATVKADSQGAPLKVFANAITQDKLARFKGEVVVSYPAIHAAFCKVREMAEATGLPVHFPLIGCGLAGGKWSDVEPLIEDALGPDIEKHLWVL